MPQPLATTCHTMIKLTQEELLQPTLIKMFLLTILPLEKLRIKGFYMDLRGKVSVVGNSKKRHLCIKLGVFSRSRKNLKFFFIKNQINTTTGVLGASYLLSY